MSLIHARPPAATAATASFVRHAGRQTTERREAIFQRPRAIGAALAPQCYIPTKIEFEAHARALLLRRAAWTMVELACIGTFLVAVLLWSAFGSGA